MTNELMEKPTEYLTDTGDKIKLTMSMVRRYLVSGKGELATDQELVFFIKTCQARKLNPFLKECYLVKYDNSPAAIITARSTFQNNARAAADCQGWRFGPIVQDENGKVRESEGLVLENEKVVGGWFSAKPKGWDEPFNLQVNLNQYIKKTRDGRPTQFWTAEKQAGMIAKVAEVQGLRTLWGKKTAGLYEADEIVDNGLDLTPMPKVEGDVVDAEWPVMTTEGFDKEFETEIADPHWKDFWQRAVDFHAEQKPPISEDQLKVDIISGEVGKFRAAFIGHAKLESNNLHDKKGPEIEAKIADTHPSVDPEQAFIDEWWNLKAAGFSTYVFKNLERFRSCSNDARGKAKLKWVKIYPKEAWPLNKAEEPESSTENDPGGPPPEDDDFKNPGADEEFNKLVMTEIWQEMSMLKEKFPHDYTRITAGQTPKTEGRVRYVIAELEKSERDTKGISNGTGGGIPG